MSFTQPTLYIYIYIYIWYFDLRPGQKFHSEWCIGRKWHILMAVMRGNRVGGNWLMKWDEVKNSHGTLIDWCTGRERPVNCMTVISAWWRSNMRFQKSSRRLSGCWTLTEVRQLQLEIGQSYRRDVARKATPGRRGSGPRLNWGPEKMLMRCSKESHHPAEWASGPPVEHLWRTRTTQRWRP